MAGKQSLYEKQLQRIVEAMGADLVDVMGADLLKKMTPEERVQGRCGFKPHHRCQFSTVGWVERNSED